MYAIDQLETFVRNRKCEDARVDQVISAFEAVGLQDPRSVVIEGVAYPRQLGESLSLLGFILALERAPSLALFLAAHCQHLGRFRFPREEFPSDRAGYKAWRIEAARRSAALATDLLTQYGFESSAIDAVVQIMTKQGRAKNSDVQVMEDALCLSFLTLDAEEFATRHSEDEMIRILSRSLLKMSDAAKAFALTLNLSENVSRLLASALRAK